MAKTPDYYALLGVKPTATEKEIKVAYRNLAKKLHPDLGGDAAKLAAVNEAADVLTDAARRASYDRERAGSSGSGAGSSTGKQPGATPPPAPEAPPPPKPTVALCEFCDTLNRVKGDPRWYPATCGKCGRPLGGGKPAEPSDGGDFGKDPFQAFQDAVNQAPTEARCPHCQQKNRVVAGPGRPISCLGCGKEFMPGTGEVEESFGQVLGDLANSLFGRSADTTTRGMRFAEDRLREMAEELRRRREELESKKKP